MQINWNRVSRIRLVARYFDSIWPEYERRVVVDSNGIATGEKLQRRRRLSFYNVSY